MKSHIALVNREFLEIIDYFDHNQLLHPVMINIFFQMRGRESAIAISSYEGYKLIFSPSENENITDVVKRGLLFADLIVLNHSTIEIEPSFCMFVLPADFPSKMPTKHQYDYSDLKGKGSPPYMSPRGSWEHTSDLYKSPNGAVGVVCSSMSYTQLPTNIAEWCLTEGRDLISNGQVTYCPNLPPATWEQYFFSKGVNFQSLYKTYRLLPQRQSYLDENVARAIQEIDLPFMANIDIKTLQKIKQDERESFEKFRSFMIEAINSMNIAPGSESFDRHMSIMNENIRAGIEEVRRVHRKIKKMKFVELHKIMFIALPTIIAAFINNPEVKLLGQSMTIAQGVIEYLNHAAENLKNKFELQNSPMYMLWRLSDESAKKDDKI